MRTSSTPSTRPPSTNETPKVEPRTIPYWPTSLTDRLDRPIDFLPCPTSSRYPRTTSGKVRA